MSLFARFGMLAAMYCLAPCLFADAAAELQDKAGNNLVSAQLPDRPAMIREFVIYNYRYLALDIVHGQGIYLDNLRRLQCVDDTHAVAFLANVRRQLLTTPHIPDFAINLSQDVAIHCTG